MITDVDIESDFSHFEKTEHFDLNRDGIRPTRTTSAYGIVVYGEKCMYETGGEQKNIHIPNSKLEIMEKMARTLEEKHSLAIRNVLAGHEHGKETQKCHMQMIVWLTNEKSITIRPGVLTMPDGTRLLYMAQRGRNPQALRNYCKKDGDFEYLHPEQGVKTIFKKLKNGEEKVDVWATVIQNSENLTRDEKMDMILTHEPRTAITMYKNIEYALDKQTQSVALPPEWAYPEHLKGKYPIIENWFTNWARPDDLLRRKALLLYSSKRAMGKTQFATRLLNDQIYVVTFRNTFSQGCIEGKTPKLVILDDMNCYTKENRETWKALVAGEPTSIRDAYMNYTWNHRAPCIITTNNPFLVYQMLSSEAFNTQIDMQEITEYMGPEGTCPVGMDKLGSVDFTQMTMDAINAFAAKDGSKYLGKKTGNNTELEKLKGELTTYKARIDDLEDTVKTTKQLLGSAQNDARKLREELTAAKKEIANLKFNCKPI